MAIFRRKIGEEEWHWCPACAGWPPEEKAVVLDEDQYPEILCPNCGIDSAGHA